jgi:hypothetical protein
MIYLNSGSQNSNPDLGIAFNYNDGIYHHAGFFRDHTDGVFKVFDNYTPEPDANIFINTADASFRLANLRATTFTGNLVGSILSTTINNTANIVSSGLSGNVVLTSPASTTSIGYLGIPQNLQTSNYTFTLADQGKHIYNTGTTGQILTIPLNSSVPFPIGTAVTFIYQSSTGASYVNATGGVTLYLAANTSGSRSNVTISPYGMGTILKVANDTWFISGAGVY